MSSSSGASNPVHSFDKNTALSEARLSARPSQLDERKKRVVVTGGSGGLGRWVVREMVDHGWDVYNCGSLSLLYRFDRHSSEVGIAPRPAKRGGDKAGVRARTHWRRVQHGFALPSQAMSRRHGSRQFQGPMLSCSRRGPARAFRGRRQGALLQGGHGRLWAGDWRLVGCRLGLAGRGRGDPPVRYSRARKSCTSPLHFAQATRSSLGPQLKLGAV